jgi:endonuclease/exonuclease/phosphatase family metal-dependent hydrolase
MFRILIVLFFTLVQSSDDIKAISYNIRYNNPKDGMNVWENRKATVMGLLNEQSADFVGLQEVVHAQLLDLVEGLPTYNYVGIGRKDGKTKGEYSPIFFKKDKYSVLQSNTFWLSETPDLGFQGLGCLFGTHLHLWIV